MNASRMHSRIHVAFQIGVILKGLNGLLELIGGILLLIFPPSEIREFIVHLSHNPAIALHISPQDERCAPASAASRPRSPAGPRGMRWGATRRALPCGSSLAGPE